MLKEVMTASKLKSLGMFGCGTLQDLLDEKDCELLEC